MVIFFLGSIRLAKQSKTSDYITGRLEILHNNVWGSVCASYQDDATAAVVCKQLGEK